MCVCVLMLREAMTTPESRGQESNVTPESLTGCGSQVCEACRVLTLILSDFVDVVWDFDYSSVSIVPQPVTGGFNPMVYTGVFMSHPPPPPPQGFPVAGFDSVRPVWPQLSICNISNM